MTTGTRDLQEATGQGAPPAPGEVDIQRHLADLASRAEVMSASNRRLVLMQRLMARIQVLSDKEFDSAYQTFESLVDKFSLAKAAVTDSGKTPARDPVREAERTLDSLSPKPLTSIRSR
jgi:hypothetical protein